MPARIDLKKSLAVFGFNGPEENRYITIADELAQEALSQKLLTADPDGDFIFTHDGFNAFTKGVFGPYLTTPDGQHRR